MRYSASLPALFLIVSLVVLISGSSQGQGVKEEAWKQYPSRETERPLLLPPGAAETRMGVRSVSTRRAFDENGRPQDTDGAYDLFTLDLSLRYGLSPHFEVLAGAPYLTGRIGETKGGAVGDIYLGGRLSLTPPTSAFEFGLGFIVSLPTSDSQYHYDFSGEDMKLQNFRTGDPSYNYYPELWFRYRTPNWAFRFTARWLLTSEGEVTYNELGGSEKNVVANPGDGYRLQASVYFQLSDRWCVGLGLDYTALSETTLDGKGQDDAMSLFELQPLLIFHFTPQVDFALGVGYPLAGQNMALGYPALMEIRSRF